MDQGGKKLREKKNYIEEVLRSPVDFVFVRRGRGKGFVFDFFFAFLHFCFYFYFFGFWGGR
jgi:hypothetical protein